ncbi:MAG: ATP-dependent DNA helicase PcrA, partial [Caldilineaceae bacterium]
SGASRPPAGNTAGTGGRVVPWSPGVQGSGIQRPAGNQPAGDGRTNAYKRRDSVQHDKYGVGTVIESKLTRDDEEIVVAFPGVGIKTLLVSAAPIKKL